RSCVEYVHGVDRISPSRISDVRECDLGPMRSRFLSDDALDIADHLFRTLESSPGRRTDSKLKLTGVDPRKELGAEMLWDQEHGEPTCDRISSDDPKSMLHDIMDQRSVSTKHRGFLVAFRVIRLVFLVFASTEEPHSEYGDERARHE